MSIMAKITVISMMAVVISMMIIWCFSSIVSWMTAMSVKPVLRNRAILPRFRFRFRVPNFLSTVPVPAPVPAPVPVPTLKV